MNYLVKLFYVFYNLQLTLVVAQVTSVPFCIIIIHIYTMSCCMWKVTLWQYVTYRMTYEMWHLMCHVTYCKKLWHGAHDMRHLTCGILLWHIIVTCDILWHVSHNMCIKMILFNLHFLLCNFCQKFTSGSYLFKLTLWDYSYIASIQSTYNYSYFKVSV